MKTIIFYLSLVVLLQGCIPTELTPDQIEREKEQVHKQILRILEGYRSKDIRVILSATSTSDELMSFGFDSSDVIHSLGDWERQIRNDIQLSDSIKFGELTHLSIQVSKTGDLAAAVFESVVETKEGAESNIELWRFSTALKKEDGMWRIIHWIVSIANDSQ